MKYDPNSKNVGHKYFPMFYEVSESLNSASFWFCNKNDYELSMGAALRSCSVCTSARVAVLDPQDKQSLTQEIAVGSFLRGAMVGPDIMTVLAAAKLERALNQKWVNLEFAKKPQSPPPNWATIPARQSDGSPTLGLLQVMFKTLHQEYKPIIAGVAVHAQDKPESLVTFNLITQGVEPFSITPLKMNFEQVGLGALPKKQTVYCVSYTRGFDETVDFPALLPPSVKPGIDPFVTISTEPVRLTDEELAWLSTSFSTDKIQHRVRSGFKYVVTLSRKLEAKSAGDKHEPEPGPLSRSFTFSVKGINKQESIEVVAEIVGLVNPVESGVIDFKKPVKVATDKEITLWSDQSDLELEVVDGEHNPNFLQATIAPESRKESARKYWYLKIHLEPRESAEPLPASCYVQLRGKTAAGETRIKLSSIFTSAASTPTTHGNP